MAFAANNVISDCKSLSRIVSVFIRLTHCITSRRLSLIGLFQVSFSQKPTEGGWWIRDEHMEMIAAKTSFSTLKLSSRPSSVNRVKG